MDRSEVRYRDLLQALRDLSARPVVPHQYAIGRNEDLVGYIDLVSEQAYAYKAGGPSDRIALPEDYREREQAARREMLETLADFDDDLLVSSWRTRSRRPSRSCAICRRPWAPIRSSRVHGRGRGRHGGAAVSGGAGAGGPRPHRPGRGLVIGPDGPTLVQILKTYYLPHAGKLSLARVWAGSVKDGMTLGDMRVGGVYRLWATSSRPKGSPRPATSWLWRGSTTPGPARC